MNIIILGLDIHGIELAGRIATVEKYNLLGFIARDVNIISDTIVSKYKKWI